MRKLYQIILVIMLGILVGYSLPLFAEIAIPGGGTLSEPSIQFTTGPGTATDVIQSTGFKILGFLKIFISGLALIYLVLIGAYMVVYSETEDKIKSQKKQITYALVGFLFLNLPGIAYTTFNPETMSRAQIGNNDNFSDINPDAPFWDATGLEGMLGIIGFLKIFIFGIAIVMFTWGLFRMIVSAGDEEIRKQGRNRIVYGLLGLIFLGFVEGWSVLVAEGNFGGEIATTAGRLLGIAVFFAAPIAVFFLIWLSYYYITSAGDEERVKKGKAIIVNTFIASIILIASYSFLKDLINFNI